MYAPDNTWMKDRRLSVRSRQHVDEGQASVSVRSMDEGQAAGNGRSRQNGANGRRFNYTFQIARGQRTVG